MDKPSAPTQGRAGLRQLLGGSAFIFGCRVGGAAITLLTQILLARWMGAAELGIYVIAFSWCLLLVTVTNLGLPMAGVRFIGQGIAQGCPGYIRGFVRHSLRVTVIVSLLAAALGIGLVWQLPLPAGFAPVLSLSLLVLPVLAVLQMLCGFANAYTRFALGFLPTNVLRPLVFFALVAAYWATRGQLQATWAMAMQFIAVCLVTLATAWAVRGFLAERLGDAPAEDHGKTWLTAAVPMLATILFTGYFAEIIIILIGFFLPPEQVAQVHVSFRLALLISFGLFAVDAATAPGLARHYAEGDLAEVQRIVDRATRVRVAGALVAIGGFAIAGRWVLGWFGAEFVAGYPLLLILAVGQLIQAGVGPVARLLSVAGQQNRALVVSLIALLLAAVLVALLVPRYGAVGGALAATLDIAIWSLGMRYVSARHTGIRPRLFVARVNH